MDDPFIYGLLLLSLFIFSLLNSAFDSINQLQLELDKTNENYNSKILSFIRKNTLEFELSVKICFILNLIILVIFTKNQINVTLSNKIILQFIFSVIVGIIVLPGIVIIPKTFGEYFSNKIINFFSIILVIIFIALAPLTYLLIFLSSAPIKIFLKDRFRSEQKDDFDKEDLNELVEESQKYTANRHKTDPKIKLFKNALEFSEIKVRDCMTPRPEIESVEISEINSNLKKSFLETGFSKIIIYKETIDNVIGFVKSKSLFTLNSEINHQIKSISFFPESMQANKLLRYFIRTGQNIAIIVDEFGGTAGVITIEDILEEIFGEIQDEHDADNPYEKQLSKTDFVFAGRLEIDYINEKYSLNLPKSEEYETIAGYILFNTENIPKINDRIIINNFLISILKVSNTKVELLKLEILDQNP